MLTQRIIFLVVLTQRQDLFCRANATKGFSGRANATDYIFGRANATDYIFGRANATTGFILSC